MASRSRSRSPRGSRHKVYYSVSPIIGNVKHDAIWVGDRVFEVENHDPLIDTSRRTQNEGERFYLLGSTSLSNHAIENIVDRYPSKNIHYNLVGNNCWHFARWLMERLGFDGMRLPNPNPVFAAIAGMFQSTYGRQWLNYRE